MFNYIVTIWTLGPDGDANVAQTVEIRHRSPEAAVAQVVSRRARVVRRNVTLDLMVRVDVVCTDAEDADDV